VSLVIDGSAKIAALREAAIGRVNARAGRARRRFITVIPGQEMIYLAKEAEARRYVEAVPVPGTLDDFPFLAAEVGITAPDAATLADVWLLMAAELRAVGAQIEHLRLGAVADIDVAAGAPAVAAAEAAFMAAIETAEAGWG
jgi:hypothetical protein